MNKTNDSSLLSYIRTSIREALNEKKKIKVDPKQTPAIGGRSMSPEDREAEDLWGASSGTPAKAPEGFSRAPKPGETKQYGFSASPKVDKKGNLIPISPEEFYGTTPLDLPQTRGPVGYETDVTTWKPKQSGGETNYSVSNRAKGRWHTDPIQKLRLKSNNLRTFFTGETQGPSGPIKTVKIFVPVAGQVAGFDRHWGKHEDRSKLGHVAQVFHEGSDIAKIHRRRWDQYGQDGYKGNHNAQTDPDYITDADYRFVSRINIKKGINNVDKNKFFDSAGNWNKDLFGPMPKSLVFDGNRSNVSPIVDGEGGKVSVVAHYSMSIEDHNKMIGAYKENLKAQGHMTEEDIDEANEKVKSHNSKVMAALKEKYGKKILVTPRWAPEQKKEDMQKAHHMLWNAYRRSLEGPSRVTHTEDGIPIPDGLAQDIATQYVRRQGILPRPTKKDILKLATKIRMNRKVEKIVIPPEILKSDEVKSMFKATVKQKGQAERELAYNKAMAAIKKSGDVAKLRSLARKGATVIYNAPAGTGEPWGADAALDDIYCTGTCETWHRGKWDWSTFDITLPSFNFIGPAQSLGYHPGSITGPTYIPDYNTAKDAGWDIVDTAELIQGMIDPRDPINAFGYALSGGLAIGPKIAGRLFKTKNVLSTANQYDDAVSAAAKTSKALDKAKDADDAAAVIKLTDEFNAANQKIQTLRITLNSEINAARSVSEIQNMGRLFPTVSDDIAKLAANPDDFRQLVLMLDRGEDAIGGVEKANRAIASANALKTAEVVQVNMALATRFNKLRKASTSARETAEAAVGTPLHAKLKKKAAQAAAAEKKFTKRFPHAESASEWARRTGASRYYDEAGNLLTDHKKLIDELIGTNERVFSAFKTLGAGGKGQEIVRDALIIGVRTNVDEGVKLVKSLIGGVKGRGAGPVIGKLKNAKNADEFVEILKSDEALPLLNSIAGKGFSKNGASFIKLLNNSTMKKSLQTALAPRIQMKFHNELRKDVLMLMGKQAEHGAVVAGKVVSEVKDEVAEQLIKAVGPGGRIGAGMDLKDKAALFGRVRSAIAEKIMNSADDLYRGTLNPVVRGGPGVRGNPMKRLKDAAKRGEPIPDDLVRYAKDGDTAKTLLRRLRMRDATATAFWVLGPDLASEALTDEPLGGGLSSLNVLIGGSDRTHSLIQQGLEGVLGDEYINFQYAIADELEEKTSLLWWALGLKEQSKVNLLRKMGDEEKDLFTASRASYQNIKNRSAAIYKNIDALDAHVQNTAVAVAKELKVDLTKFSKLPKKQKQQFFDALEKKDRTAGILFRLLSNKNLTGGKFNTLRKGLTLFESNTDDATKYRFIHLMRARIPGGGGETLASLELANIDGFEAYNRHVGPYIPAWKEKPNSRKGIAGEVTEQAFGESGTTLGHLIEAHEGSQLDRRRHIFAISAAQRRIFDILKGDIQFNKLLKKKPELAKKLNTLIISIHSAEHFLRDQVSLDRQNKKVTKQINNFDSVLFGTVSGRKEYTEVGAEPLGILNDNVSPLKVRGRYGYPMVHARNLFNRLFGSSESIAANILSTKGTQTQWLREKLEKYMARPGTNNPKLTRREKAEIVQGNTLKNNRIKAGIYLFVREILVNSGLNTPMKRHLGERQKSIWRGEGLDLNKVMMLFVDGRLKYKHDGGPGIDGRGSLVYKNTGGEEIIFELEGDTQGAKNKKTIKTILQNEKLLIKRS